MKWEPIALMVLLPVLGVWLIWVQGMRPGLPEHDPGARLVDFRAGTIRGAVEIAPAADGADTYRLLYRNGESSETMSANEFRNRFGEPLFLAVTNDTSTGLFRLLNITAWAGLAWVAIGLGGQAAFFGRMLIQWVVSEKKRQSVVPEAF
ncbi:MAG: lipid-A-disaccharide synthase N-terminal domain-containing protein, partial [Planctomycetota bacterium]